MMKLLKNFLLTLGMVYSLVCSQVTAAESVKKEEGSGSPQTRQQSTDRQNEGSTLKQQAIKFYARNYGVINFATVVVPIAACSVYGISSFVGYVHELHQQQTAQREKFQQQLRAQREQYHHNCELAAKECNGTWIPTDNCQADLAQSMCYNVLFDCVSRLCGWDLLFVPNSANNSAQLLVNTNFNSKFLSS